MAIGRSREDYLKAIYVLQGQGGNVRSMDVARYLKVSRASVSAMVSALVSEGYVEKLPRTSPNLVLTDRGRRIAAQIYDRHCFFRRLLLSAGVDDQTADREACELEHAISPESFRLLRGALELRAE